MAFRTMMVEDGRKDAMAWKCATEDFEFGARLTVQQSQVAVFFRDGKAVEVLGPGMHVLETRTLPFLRLFTKLKFGRCFHAEVYFVNLSVQMAVPWGTRERVNMMLEVEPGKAMPLSIGASGTMNVQPDPEQVKDMLTWLLGTGSELTAEGMRDKFNSMLNMKLKTFLARAIEQYHFNAFSLDQHTVDVSNALLEILKPEFLKYGILLREFFLENFSLPEDDPAFQEARMLNMGRYIQHGKLDLEYELKQKQAEQELKLKQLEGQQRILEAQVGAQVTVATAQGEATRRELEGITSIQEHKFETMNNMINAGAVSGGTGGASAPAGGGMGDMTNLMGDVMKLGVGIEMAKNLGGVMRDVMNSGAQTGMNMAGLMGGGVQQTAGAPTGQPAQEGGWICPQCGKQNPADNCFCGKCGKQKGTD